MHLDPVFLLALAVIVLGISVLAIGFELQRFEVPDA